MIATADPAAVWYGLANTLVISLFMPRAHTGESFTDSSAQNIASKRPRFHLTVYRGTLSAVALRPLQSCHHGSGWLFAVHWEDWQFLSSLSVSQDLSQRGQLQRSLHLFPSVALSSLNQDIAIVAGRDRLYLGLGYWLQTKLASFSVLQSRIFW